MKNVTLSIDEAVLDEARVYAAKRKTTVNALVRDYLTRIASEEDRVARARTELRKLARRSTAEVGSITWTRDSLYDRRG
jgi:Family of unknown function (DUF6364)